jgi:ribonuclease R
MYTPKPLGHYGLAKPNYTHFTSPIRRYADLLVHRLLFRDRRQATPYTTEELSRLCLHISNTERVASEAEQESVKLKKLEYFDREARASQRSSFTALVLEIRPNGLVVEIPEYVIQGRIRISSLEGDLFDFSPQRQELKGQRTGALLAPGLALTVEVESVDLAKRQVDFKVKKAVILKIAKDAKGE